MSITRRLIFAALLLSACALFASLSLFAVSVDAKDIESENIVAVTDDTLDSATAGQDTIIKLHAPWCLICKRFEPVYSTVADEWKAKNSNLRFVSVDVEDNRAVALRFLVTAVPSLFYIAANRSVRSIPLSLSAEVVSQNIDAALTEVSTSWTSPYINPFSLHMRAFGKIISSTTFLLKYYEKYVMYYSITILGGSVEITGPQIFVASFVGLSILFVACFFIPTQGSSSGVSVSTQQSAQASDDASEKTPVESEPAAAEAAATSAAPAKTTRARRTKAATASPAATAEVVEKAPRRSTRRKAEAEE